MAKNLTKKTDWIILTQPVEYYLFLHRIFYWQKGSFKLCRITGDFLHRCFQSTVENQGIYFVGGVAFIPCQSCETLNP